MSTHGLAVTGTGGTAAGATTQIGSDITMPAGGPWIIHHIWGQVVKSTTVANEGTGGILKLTSLAGDITPDPAPGKYPLIGTPVSESVNSAISAVPLNLWPVNWSAAGKATLKLDYINQLAITTGSTTLGGVLFSDSAPQPRSFTFCDSVSGSFASTSEQSIGTITLSERASRIVGIMADLNKGDAPTAGQAIAATIRLDSADVKLPPSQYPCNRAFNASDGTAVGQSSVAMSNFIPVDIPIIGGARIDCFATSTISVSGNADISIYIAYE